MFILKTELNSTKKIKTELKKIYGLNSFLIDTLCRDLGLNSLSTLKDLKLRHLGLIQNWVVEKNVVVNDDLKKFVIENKKKLITLKCYKGFRHEEGLPVRGQRTRTNARTQKRLSSFFKKKSPIKSFSKKNR